LDTRNNGIKRALGKYLCFVDADDILENNFIEIMLNEISEKNVDIVFCNYFYIYGNKMIPKNIELNLGFIELQK